MLTSGALFGVVIFGGNTLIFDRLMAASKPWLNACINLNGKQNLMIRRA